MRTRPAKDKQDRAAYFKQRYAAPHDRTVLSPAEAERLAVAREKEGSERAFTALIKQALDPLLAEGRALGAVITPCKPRPIATETPIITEQPLVATPSPVEQHSRPPETPIVTERPLAATSQSEQRSRPSKTVVAADAELARIAVALKQAQLFRVWLVMLQRVRESGKNYLSRVELAAALTSAGIKYTERSLRRWLQEGNSTYWHLTPYSRVKFIGYENLAKSLTQHAYAVGLPDLVSTNIPGQRKYMYIPVSSDRLIEFEANVYAAWLASKEDPTISRFVLTTLFNRDVHTLREWEDIAGVKTVQNFTHYTTEYATALPQNDEGDDLREDVQKRTVRRKGAEITIWRAQMANTYHTPAIKQHSHRGQSCRVARKIRQMLESSEPAGIYGRGADEQSSASGGLQPTGHLYFSDHKRAKSSAKHSGDYDKPRFVPLAADGKDRYIWEYSPDGRQRLDYWECVQKKTKRTAHA